MLAKPRAAHTGFVAVGKNAKISKWKKLSLNGERKLSKYKTQSIKVQKRWGKGISSESEQDSMSRGEMKWLGKQIT